ncbi:MAG: hypothetical protein Q8K62_05940 [Thiobacillus sp.]|nr:hypothetical protein [Thiobacillus sp.]
MKLRTAMFFALSLAAMSPAYAADVKDAMEDRAEARYDAEKDTARHNYEIAKENCKSLSGDAKDVCMKDAKAEYVKVTSQAKVEKKSGEEQAEATGDQMKAYYKAAKEKCDQLSGNAQDSCVNDAKLKYRQ